MEFYFGLNPVNRNLEDFPEKRELCESTNTPTTDQMKCLPMFSLTAAGCV